MSMVIKMNLDQVWSITDAGWLCVETVPKGNTKMVFGDFTFSSEIILEQLDEDIELGFDLLDWVNLKNNLKELSDEIEQKLNGDAA